MTTRLSGSLKRELDIGGEPYTLTVHAEGLKLVPKGGRKGHELAWSALVSGEAALATALNASLAATVTRRRGAGDAETPAATRSPATGTPAATPRAPSTAGAAQVQEPTVAKAPAAKARAAKAPAARALPAAKRPAAEAPAAVEAPAVEAPAALKAPAVKSSRRKKSTPAG